MKTKQFIAAAVAAALFLVTGIAGISAARTRNTQALDAARQVRELFYPEDENSLPEEDFLAWIDITGTIQPSSESYFRTSDGGYDHYLYLDYIDDLMDSPYNKGIFLYTDSPGGTVYEADEMYLKLMEYKDATSRPVYAYFASEACSGAYYIAMAADEIYANRNCMTGSIGVIISLTNYSELMEKIGVREIDITTGANKTMGSGAEEMSEEQRAIFQSMVDEAYEQFLDVVERGRDLPRERLRELADGRIYTAMQALENGLIDHIMGEDETLDAILDRCGLDPDAPLYAPSSESPMDFLTDLFYMASGARRKSDLEIFREMSRERNGVLLAYAG